MPNAHAQPQPKAHDELFQTTPAHGTQALLTDFALLLPQPEHDPEQDLIGDPMDDRPRSNVLKKLREGTVVTLNTAVQGVVSAKNEVGHEELWHVPVSTIDTPTIFTIEAFNIPDVDEIHLVKDGAHYKDDYQLYYQLPDGRRTDIEHIAACNENNLADTIDVNLYETFKQHTGERALRIDSNSVDVVTLTGAEDGDISFATSKSRTKTKTVTGNLSYTWYLAASKASPAPSPTVLTPSASGEESTTSSTSPFGTDTAHELTSDQEAALDRLAGLPEGEYWPTGDGLILETKLDRNQASLRVASAETLSTALSGTFLSKGAEDTVRAPDRDSPGGPDACITTIIGIGEATAADISGVSRDTTPSKSDVREQFEKGEMNAVREVPEDDDVRQALEEAQEDFEPTETITNGDGEYLTISEFCDDALPLFNAARRYFTRAVGDMRAYFADNGGLDEQAIVRIHAGATNARMFDDSGDKLGLLPELMFDQFSVEDIATATAWDGYSGDAPLPKPEKGDLQYAVSRNIPNSLELTDHGRWQFNRTETIPATTSNLRRGIVTFTDSASHEDVGDAFANNEIAAAILPSDVVEYVNALFGIDLMDDETVEELVSISDDHALIVEHPTLDVVFQAFDYKEYDPGEDEDDE